MMAPLPNTAPERNELPHVRLEMRTGSGRTVGYEIGGNEFLIGSAPGCDLRLPLPNLPPVAAQITRKADGIRVRRVAPGLPVLLNSQPLPTNTATLIRNGDCLDIGGIEIVLNLTSSGFVSPKLIPIEPDPEPEIEPLAEELAALRDEIGRLEERKRRLDADHTARFEALVRREAGLAERERDIAEQTEELKADRVVWYRRREEMERDLEQRRVEQEAALASDKAREAKHAERERELDRTRDDVNSLREQVREASFRLEEDRRRFEKDRSLADQEVAERLAANRQELERQYKNLVADREILERARASFEAEQIASSERSQLWEATLTTRDAELAHRENTFHHERLAFERDRKQFTEDLVRLERKQAALAEIEHQQEAREAEIRIRAEQLNRDAADLSERSRLLGLEEDRLRSEAERFDRQRTELDARATVLSQRASELEAQQATLMVLRARLDVTRQDAEREAMQLAKARVREEESQDQLRQRIREAEQLRAELNTVQENTADERRRLEERDSLLNGGLEEIRQQREALAHEEARLREKAEDLDNRVSEFAEQAGALKGRLALALDLQARLEADRVALREREASLAQAEEARQTLQEQIRRRAEELSSRAKALDEMARTLSTQKSALDQALADVDAVRATAEQDADRMRADAEARVAEIARQEAALAEKEAALTRQVSRLQDVGRAVAEERKTLAETRSAWEADRATFLEADRKAREEADTFRTQVAAELEALRAQVPELDEQSRAALDRLNAARGMFRGHLTELHDYAKQTREDLEVIRAMVREETDRLRAQEQELNGAKAEHRLAVTAFRQQLIEWQGRVADIKQTLSHSESRLEAKEAAVKEAARQIDSNTMQLAEQTEQLRRERQAVAWKRTSVERHLSDMREWYRKKLRDLAHPDSQDGSSPPNLRLAGALTAEELPSVAEAAALAGVEVEELEPGDLQLGELLLASELVEASSMAGLWAEAKRQRRTLRQVLLASGAITLYQLALIEAGNLDALMLGRFRVIDRVRTTPRESLFRVFDPTRADEPGGGLFLLRHLSELEAQDAVHPDEFRQRFAAARDAAHPNLAGVWEVLEIQGRPAVLQEWLTGLPGSDFPAFAAHPGCWVKLASMAADGLATAHRAGLVHGRITSDSLVLTADGVLKLTGFADPPWLEGQPSSTFDPTPALDLRALGQVVFGWSQLVAKRRGGKPFPEALATVIRRLEADPAPPMEDTVAADRPYESAAELAADLKQISLETPFNEDAWEKLLRHVAEHAPEAPALLRRSA